VKQWVVYLVECADGSYYCGISNDLAKRLTTHNAGKGAKYTKTRRPVSLLWSIDVADKSAALKLEWKVKQLSRDQKRAFKD